MCSQVLVSESAVPSVSLSPWSTLSNCGAVVVPAGPRGASQLLVAGVAAACVPSLHREEQEQGLL